MSPVICPQCQKPIDDEDALLCHFCGASLNRVSGGLLGTMRGAGFKWIWITLALVMAAAMILTMF